MTLPLIDYPLSSQNQRVIGYEIPGDEQVNIYSATPNLSASEIDELIWTAYRQLFNEQQIATGCRQINNESLLKNGQITVKEFMVRLATSETFRHYNYEPNSNYRFVEMCIQRLLGREVFNEREKYAWSTVLATKGLQGFIQDLVNTDEYLDNFGENTVPYQRRRILPQRDQGNVPFARIPRYSEDYRQKLEEMGNFRHELIPSYRWQWQRPPYPVAVQLLGKALVIGGAIAIILLFIAVTLSAWEIISL